MVQRGPLHTKGPGPTKAGPPADRRKATPKFNRRATDTLDRESQLYPDSRWPMGSTSERLALVQQIEQDLAKGLLDPIAAYHERLHWAFRCMKEGV